jgi:glycosyltransferase involved in cell wall biosynthesis
MKIFYLYSKIMPYQIPVIKEFVTTYNAEVHIVYWDKKGNAPYVPPTIQNTTFYKRSEFSVPQLATLVAQINPNVIFISGWTDKGYLKVVKPYRRKGTPIITGFDEVWSKTLRQRVGAIIFPFFLYNYFTHAWVSGPRQYEFAKKLGFKDSHILNHLYAGNTDLFNGAVNFLESKAIDYPKTFLFVGRLVPAKGIDILAQAFQIYRTKYKGNWDLVCVGRGELRPLLEGVDNITIHDFLDQDTIFSMLKDTGAFVLASRFDVSPLVVHEFASAGLPLILSEKVGNRLLFLIEKFNGFLFKNESPESLALAMYKMEQTPTSDLIKMGNNSHQLSKVHNAKFVAASFISAVPN